MKAVATLITLIAITVALTACAPAGSKQVQVKCPACGYEFMAPSDK